jgi:drug/metabolite transporter (DMT)-like permease
MKLPRAVWAALAAAALFGASTPWAKWLGGQMHPQLLAGLLYLGSGTGLAGLMALRRLRRPAGSPPEPGLPRNTWLWLAAAVLAGGVLGPVLLMTGLQATPAATAALLLNLEGVFTALLAWWVFKEHADRQLVLGMAAIVAGGVLLSLPAGSASWTNGALLVMAACLCWGVDNNLTRKVSHLDALQLAGIKGLVAGLTNTALALALGAAWPSAPVLAATLLLGFAGYGLSLVLFVLALRGLGTARTGAYFSVAPLFGVVVAWWLWPAWPDPLFWPAAALMALGLWLHVRERHAHEHQHEAMAHAHRHRHDAHHQHAHDFDWDGAEPHNHPHQHPALTHRHAHFPDLHHRHGHGAAMNVKS